MKKGVKDSQQKADLHKVMFGAKPKTKVNPSKPIMEINQENSIWMAHCINKKTNRPMGLELNLKINIGFIRATLTQNGQEIGTGESKHDINEAINKVKEAFAINNLFNFLTSKPNEQSNSHTK